MIAVGWVAGRRGSTTLRSAVGGGAMVVLVLAGASATASAQTRGDFNGDGFGDLAIGMPSHSVGTIPGAGAVMIVYGSPTGPQPGAGVQVWHQDSPGVAGQAEAGDRFGSSLATADFNGDGRSDLAIGVPREDVGAIVDAGVVVVLYGSPSGLTGAASQEWHSDSPDVMGVAEEGDRFGSTLAAGRSFLAIGTPDEQVTVTKTIGATVSYDVFAAGAVTVLYFDGPGGLTGTGSQEWTDRSAGGLAGIESADAYDYFGQALAIGDFGLGEGDDLAIGVPGQSVNGNPSAGAVTVLYSRATASGFRLSSNGNQRWHQDVTGVPGAAEYAGGFGRSLAAGRFVWKGAADTGLVDDLMIGVPGQTVNGQTRAGAIVVLPALEVLGSDGQRAAILTAINSQLWVEDSFAAAEEPYGGFGRHLSVGDFNRDGWDDLAIGLPTKDSHGRRDTGAVYVAYGAGMSHPTFGSIAAFAEAWNQGSPGIANPPQTGDAFGSGLTCLDLDGDGFDDLIIGAPNEDVLSVTTGLTAVNAGGFYVLRGSSVLGGGGLIGTAEPFWTKNSLGVPGLPSASNDQLGFVLR